MTLPVYLNTDDAVQAWSAGLAWAFMIGVIVMIGAFVGPYIRKFDPAGGHALGTLAGISITFISMRPAAQMWEAASTGLPVLAIILIGFFTDVKLPFGIPVGLAALLVGTAIGWIGGYMSAPDVGQAFSDIAVGIPDLRLDPVVLRAVQPGAVRRAPQFPCVYNFTEAMKQTLEERYAARDNYNLRSVLLADGAGAVVGSAFGSPFPPAVYIGHPGWKDAGGRAGYSLASGVVIGIFCFLGLFGVLDGAAAGACDRADPAVHRPV